MYRSFNMGSRGRMPGHREFRPDIFAGMIGLFFFGWIIIAVIGGLAGCGLMMLGAIARSLVCISPRLFTGLLSARSMIAGLILGLIWYFRRHGRNTAEENEIREEVSGTDDTAVENETIDVPAHRTFSA